MSAKEVPASIKRWPARKRCYTCRSYFGFIVLRGLYCSYECAGVPEPDRMARPRSCYVVNRRNGRPFTRSGKLAFFSRDEAEQSACRQNDPLLSVYECEHCLLFHHGHNWKEINEMLREEMRARQDGRGRILIAPGESCS